MAKRIVMHARLNSLIVLFLLQTCKATKDIGSLQKAEDFVKAFAVGFAVEVR